MTSMEQEGELVGFDVEAYAAKYGGRNRVNRLQFISQHAPSLRNDALQILRRNLRESMNMDLYEEILKQTSSNPEAAMTEESAHMQTVRRNAKQQYERLEQEVESYKSSMIKESIRMGHNDLGRFYYEIGDLQSALKSYAQTRDYCTSDRHIIEMCLNVVRVGLHLGNYSHVVNYLNKLEQVSRNQNDTRGQDPMLTTKMSAAFGLVMLHDKKYHAAAGKFAECNVEIGSTYNEVVHAEDIALYGGICALASFNRDELKDKVIQNASFKMFLELLPWLRELITDFYSGDYATCLQTLEKYKPELMLDIYLRDHVETLSCKIRQRAIVQYFSPYASVDLRKMAAIFQTSTDQLEDEVCELIGSNKLAARLDSYQKVLYAYEPDRRTVAYQEAFEMGQSYMAESRNLLLRMSLMKNGLIIRE